MKLSLQVDVLGYGKYLFYDPEDVGGLCLLCLPPTLLKTLGCYCTYVGSNGL